LNEANLEKVRSLISTVKGVVNAIDLALKKEVSPVRKITIQAVSLITNPIFYVVILIVFILTAIVFYKLGEYRTYKAIYKKWRE